MELFPLLFSYSRCINNHVIYKLALSNNLPKAGSMPTFKNIFISFTFNNLK